MASADPLQRESALSNAWAAWSLMTTATGQHCDIIRKKPKADGQWLLGHWTKMVLPTDADAYFMRQWFNQFCCVGVKVGL